MFAEVRDQIKAIVFEDNHIQILQTSRTQQAVLYKALTKKGRIGDTVLLNTTASELNLGTGGYDFVKSAGENAQGTPCLNRDDGHILKLRYTPMQHQVLSVESQESPYHSLFQTTYSLEKRPVLVGELHSMIPILYAGSKVLHKRATVCIIIDDQAALPLMLSEHIRALEGEETFVTITVGQAFGGTYEAVTIQTALQFAHKHLKADIIMITVGPGVVGTGSYYGFTGMSLANWSNNVAALGGVPVWIPRLSFADKRKRHRGISHHTLTPLIEAVLTKVILPLPLLNGDRLEMIENQLSMLQKAKVSPEIKWIDEQEVQQKTEQALRTLGKDIKTMGRGYQEDPAFFWAVVAALWTSLNLGRE
ncbi:DUF3866 family protein [Alkalihalophilus pseudofirmus]|uniref:DUF3866 family protein n=1 Tax=Alkalihalophilus pseudofirmus TaxID=79885 RepID=UPI00259AFA26|nr:DUF3866 family protein [Alkalihalophilus pseudofirmus]WEG18201.1 DUF3866 family protein [Alkalihalophilus pseudofirmus]